MPIYEYKTVPAPRKGEKAKGIKGADGRLAQAMQSLLNTYGAEGWEYQRAETLPVEERSGIASKTISYQSVLIFRRALQEVVEPSYAAAEPEMVEEEFDESAQTYEDTAEASVEDDAADENDAQVPDQPHKPEFTLDSAQLRASRD